MGCGLTPGQIKEKLTRNIILTLLENQSIINMYHRSLRKRFSSSVLYSVITFFLLFFKLFNYIVSIYMICTGNFICFRDVYSSFCIISYNCEITCSTTKTYFSSCGLFGWSRCARYRYNSMHILSDVHETNHLISYTFLFKFITSTTIYTTNILHYSDSWYTKNSFFCYSYIQFYLNYCFKKTV